MEIEAFLVVSAVIAIFAAILGGLGWLVSRWLRRKDPAIIRRGAEPIVPSTAFIAGEVVGYCSTAAYEQTFGPPESAARLFGVGSLVVIFVIAVALAVIFEMHVYKRLSNLQGITTIDALAEQSSANALTVS